MALKSHLTKEPCSILGPSSSKEAIGSRSEQCLPVVCWASVVSAGAEQRRETATSCSWRAPRHMEGKQPRPQEAKQETYCRQLNTLGPCVINQGRPGRSAGDLQGAPFSGSVPGKQHIHGGPHGCCSTCSQKCRRQQGGQRCRPCPTQTQYSGKVSGDTE